MLHEAKIVLPLANTLEHHAAHSFLRLVLVEKWRGFTLADGVGCWVPPGQPAVNPATLTENVKVYTVAMEATHVNARALRTIAQIAGKRCDQKCVYVRYPSGDIELVECTP